MDALIPSPHLIAFEKLTVSGLEMTIEAKTTRTVVHCPECQQPTQKVHSSYRGRPRDLPTAGLSVRLLLLTRKFYFENSDCSRSVFCERLPGCVKQYAHCTASLNQHLIWMELALGGELGARLAGKLGYVVSAATLIQRVRNLASSTKNPASEIKMLGIDDFALQRLHHLIESSFQLVYLGQGEWQDFPQLFTHPIGGRDIGQGLGRLLDSRSARECVTEQLTDDGVVDFGPETTERPLL